MSDSDRRKLAEIGRLVVLALLLVAAMVAAYFALRIAAEFQQQLVHAYPEHQPQGGSSGEGSPSWSDARAAWYASASFEVAVFQLVLSIVGAIGLVATVFWARAAWKEAEASAIVARDALEDTRRGASEQMERFILQLNAARTAASAADSGARAMARSATATAKQVELTRENAERELRAYVCQGEAHLRNLKIGDTPQVHVVMNNCGRTPA